MFDRFHNLFLLYNCISSYHLLENCVYILAAFSWMPCVHIRICFVEVAAFLANSRFAMGPYNIFCSNSHNLWLDILSALAHAVHQPYVNSYKPHVSNTFTITTNLGHTAPMSSVARHHGRAILLCGHSTEGHLV